MKIIIYQGKTALFSGDPINLRQFFSGKEKDPPSLPADRVELYAMENKKPTSTMTYEEFLTLLE